MENLDIFIKTAKTSFDFSAAKEIILEYVDWLGFNLEFQNFDYEINNLQEMYSEPEGSMFLASINNKFVGVAGIRKFENNICELKRMYVKPEYRNKGIGRKILEYSIESAKKFNYEKMKLDTDDLMQAAIKLYLDFGFEEIPAYRNNPNVCARYFELKLKKNKL